MSEDLKNVWVLVNDDGPYHALAVFSSEGAAREAQQRSKSVDGVALDLYRCEVDTPFPLGTYRSGAWVSGAARSSAYRIDKRTVRDPMPGGVLYVGRGAAGQLIGEAFASSEERARELLEEAVEQFLIDEGVRRGDG